MMDDSIITVLKPNLLEFSKYQRNGDIIRSYKLGLIVKKESLYSVNNGYEFVVYCIRCHKGFARKNLRGKLFRHSKSKACFRLGKARWNTYWRFKKHCTCDGKLLWPASDFMRQAHRLKSNRPDFIKRVS